MTEAAGRTAAKTARTELDAQLFPLEVCLTEWSDRSCAESSEFLYGIQLSRQFTSYMRR